MKTHRLIQGSPEWHTHRALHFNASDAPAMMGCSSYKSRTALIREIATGMTVEVDEATQRRFDDGHRFEALARPLAEEMVGKELYPVTGSNGRYSASFDGLSMRHDTGFEHKTLNKALREAMHAGCTGADLPLQYRVQMEQQAMVSGCERILFMASEWTGDGQLIEERHCWYEPDAELRAQIIAGWEQLEKDVAAYAPPAASLQVVPTSVAALPAVVVQVTGSIAVTDNFDEFEIATKAFVETKLIRNPKADQDFADLEAQIKMMKAAEDALDASESQMLAQVEAVYSRKQRKDMLHAFIRENRLLSEKLVKSEKDRLKTVLVTGAQQDLDAHVAALNQRLGANWLPRIAGGFAETIKGLKSLDSMRDKVAVALTNAKHDANQLADRLEANRKHLVQDDGDWIALFADFATVGTKAAEDFQALAALRIGNHKQAEKARLEQERERIRAEEAARLEREAAAKAQQEAEQERLRIQQQAQQDQAEIAQAQQTGTLAAPVAQDLAGLVQDKAVEGVAGIDAQQAIAAAKAGTAVADSSETITLGEINTMIAPLKIDAAGLAELGFTPCFTVKAAKHYRCSSLPAICRALIDRLDSVLATV